MLQPLTQLNHYISVCFKEFLVGAEVWAGSMSLLTRLVCRPAKLLNELGSSAAGMAQLYNQHPLHTKATYHNI
jgi:hypothetical protein